MPGLPALVLFQHVEQLYARELPADKCGGLGCLLKGSVFEADEFIDALERVAAGGSALDPAMVSKLFGCPGAASRSTTLTERERLLLALMAEGSSNSAIAALFFISEGTVSKYTTTTFDKLRISDDGSATDASAPS